VRYTKATTIITNKMIINLIHQFSCLKIKSKIEVATSPVNPIKDRSIVAIIPKQKAYVPFIPDNASINFAIMVPNKNQRIMMTKSVSENS